MDKKEAEKRRLPPKKVNRLNPPTKNYISLCNGPDSINKQKDSLFERYYRIKNENYNSEKNLILVY